jgi:glutamate 5-kinase
MLKYKKIVIKVGSNVLTDSKGGLDTTIIAHLVDQIAILKKSGIEVILISSGAVASGRGIVKLTDKSDAISSRQVLASVGQVKLLNTYYELFNTQKIICSQVLVTKEDFRDRSHYMNMRNCFAALLQNNIIPIVNENDVISITELMFTDNDELAGLIATMMSAEALIILSNVDGIFTGDPKHPDSKILNVIDEKQVDFSKYVQTTKSEFGRGGMITKCNIALKVSKTGIAVHIANGKKDHILKQLIADNNYTIGTTFLPVKTASGAKKRIAFSETFAKGTIYVNEGAKKALISDNASSLLSVGVTKITGEFQTGDVVRILDEKEQLIGMGKVQYNSQKAKELIGQKGLKPLVHYDYLYLNG